MSYTGRSAVLKHRQQTREEGEFHQYYEYAHPYGRRIARYGAKLTRAYDEGDGKYKRKYKPDKRHSLPESERAHDRNTEGCRDQETEGIEQRTAPSGEQINHNLHQQQYSCDAD